MQKVCQKEEMDVLVKQIKKLIQKWILIHF